MFIKQCSGIEVIPVAINLVAPAQVRTTIDPDQPAAKNHTAVAFDAKTATAYFRVIQYGKHVPACDRGIRLK